MSPWMEVLMSSSPVLVTQTFTSSRTWVAPAGTTSVDMSGYGARGQDAFTDTNYSYSKTTSINATRRDNGQVVEVSTYTTYGYFGTPPFFYCDPLNDTPSDPNYSSNRTCYSFADTRTETYVPQSTGASATGLGNTFPGSAGNTPQTTKSVTNVAVAPGASYNFVVPTGGSITISYYA